MKQALTEVAAVRLVERLLPGECEACDGFRGVDVRAYPGEVVTAVTTCPVCYGSGQVWDEGIVEAVARAIYESLKSGVKPWNETGEEAKDIWRMYARAVLSALVELLTEKVET